MRRFIFAVALFVGIGSISVVRGEGGSGDDIVDTAIAAGSFKTLVRALDAASLTEVLKSPGPFTVLAPNDEAFAALPEGTLDALLKDKQKLASVVTYHFIPGRASLDDVKKLESVKSSEGETLTIKVADDRVHLNGATILKSDIICTNGVIHVIDSVLLPPRPTPPAVKQAKAILFSAEEIEPARQIAELKRVMGEVLKTAGHNVLAKEALDEALSQADELEELEPKLLALREGLREAVEMLQFTPFREAKLPKGFPDPTPVGEIQLKTYPKYRVARVEMADGTKEGRAFFTLFQHIVRNRIEMTAPVEMTYNGSGPKQETAMAFLYESTEIGALGESGKVQVADVPEMMALSLGLRGDYSADQVAKGEQYLKQWLKQQSDHYEVAGELRVLGYNSPFIPAERRYAEVQLPVRSRTKEAQ